MAPFLLRSRDGYAESDSWLLLGVAPFLAATADLAWCEVDHDRRLPMRIADVLKNKGTAVVTISPETTVTELLAGLTELNIGAMVVMGPDGLAGIVSERDVVRKLHERGSSLLAQPVSEIMTTVVATCTPRDTVDHLSALMTENRVRHIPVLDEGRLAGIVSIGDIVKTRMEELEAEQEQLQAYITQGR
ncbi:histidine kinase [Mycolicibacterium boenickei]|uniref:Histidine kinase n=4 Tax=Mycolicibacterium TaxID=1866885 RepID=A0ABM7IY35_9MYCO|nr:histidine kinase [Mycolicibacterium boenickei]